MPIRRKQIELSPRLKLGVGRGHSNKLLKYGAFACLSLAVILAAHASWLVLKGGQPGDAGAPRVLGATDIRQVSDGGQPAPRIIEYQVGKGDTLFNISQKFNISWTTVATLNNLSSPFTLKPGQILKIPQ